MTIGILLIALGIIFCLKDFRSNKDKNKKDE